MLSPSLFFVSVVLTLARLLGKLENSDQWDPKYGKVLPGTENRSDLIARGVTESGLENRASRGSDTRPKAQAFCLQ